MVSRGTVMFGTKFLPVCVCLSVCYLPAAVWQSIGCSAIAQLAQMLNARANVVSVQLTLF